MLFKTNSIFCFLFFVFIKPRYLPLRVVPFVERYQGVTIPWQMWGLPWAWASAFLTWQSLVKPKLIFKCELVNGKVQRRPRGAASENSCVSSHPRPGAVPLVGHLCLDTPENIMLEMEVSISGLKETVKMFVSQRELAETQQRLRLL